MLVLMQQLQPPANSQEAKRAVGCWQEQRLAQSLMAPGLQLVVPLAPLQPVQHHAAVPSAQRADQPCPPRPSRMRRHSWRPLLLRGPASPDCRAPRRRMSVGARRWALQSRMSPRRFRAAALVSSAAAAAPAWTAARSPARAPRLNVGSSIPPLSPQLCSPCATLPTATAIAWRALRCRIPGPDRRPGGRTR